MIIIVYMAYSIFYITADCKEYIMLCMTVDTGSSLW